MDWFLYDNGLRHEKVKAFEFLFGNYFSVHFQVFYTMYCFQCIVFRL